MSNISDLEYSLGVQENRIFILLQQYMLRKQIVGEENVFNFTIGNPAIPCPKILNETLINLLKTETDVIIHGYSASRGNPMLREKIVQNLNETYNTHYTVDNIFLTLGASAALCYTLKTLLTSEDQEVIIFAPYFSEYKVYPKIAPCKIVEIPPDIPNFQINLEKLEQAINKNTKVLIINTPNNPAGTIYSEETLKKLGGLLTMKEKEFGSHIYLVSDEPYREIIFDGKKFPYPANYYYNTITCYSFSKSVSIPGERVGYSIVNPNAYESQKIINAIAGAARVCGHVCVPTLIQIALSKIIGTFSDMSIYEENRNILYKGLKELGYEPNLPEGSFYLFLKTLEPDSLNFVKRATEFDIFVVPADDFGCPGYVRVAFCVNKEMIKKSMVAFKKLKDSYQ